MLSELRKQHQDHLSRRARLGDLTLRRPQAAPSQLVPSRPEDEAMRRIEREIIDLRRTLAAQAELLQNQQELVGRLALEAFEIRPMVSDVIAAVCAFYKINRRDLCSDRRTADLVKPRQVAYFLCRKMTGLSFPVIGRRLGKKDHTSALHGSNKIEGLIEIDDELSQEVKALEANIAERVMSRREQAT